MKDKTAIRVLDQIEYYLKTHTNESCEEEHAALARAKEAIEEQRLTGEIYEFKVKCTEPMQGLEKGKVYPCTTKDFRAYSVKTGDDGITFDTFKVLLNHFEVYEGISLPPIPPELVDHTLADSIYRHVDAKYIKEDVISHASDLEVSLTSEEVNEVAIMYAYDGEYDCNLSYWQNIENLINEVVDRRPNL